MSNFISIPNVIIEKNPIQVVGDYKLFGTNFSNLYITKICIREFIEYFNSNSVFHLKCVQDISEIVYITEYLKTYNINVIFSDNDEQRNIDFNKQRNNNNIKTIERKLLFNETLYETNLYALWFIPTDDNITDDELEGILNNIPNPTRLSMDDTCREEDIDEVYQSEINRDNLHVTEIEKLNSDDWNLNKDYDDYIDELMSSSDRFDQDKYNKKLSRCLLS